MSDREVRRGVSLMLNGAVGLLDDETLSALVAALYDERRRRKKFLRQEEARAILDVLSFPFMFTPMHGYREHQALGAALDGGSFKMVTACGRNLLPLTPRYARRMSRRQAKELGKWCGRCWSARQAPV